MELKGQKNVYKVQFGLAFSPSNLGLLNVSSRVTKEGEESEKREKITCSTPQISGLRKSSRIKTLCLVKLKSKNDSQS